MWHTFINTPWLFRNLFDMFLDFFIRYAIGPGHDAEGFLGFILAYPREGCDAVLLVDRKRTLNGCQLGRLRPIRSLIVSSFNLVVTDSWISILLLSLLSIINPLLLPPSPPLPWITIHSTPYCIGYSVLYVHILFF